MQRRYHLQPAIFFASILLITDLTAIRVKPQSSPRSNRDSDPYQQQTNKSEKVEPDVVRVDTDLVNTLFTAVDKDHHFITNLRAEDIRIFENGRQQEISLFERETDRRLSIAVLVDTSESQTGVLEDEKKAALTFVNSVIRADRDRAAILSFTGATRVEQDLTNEMEKLENAVAVIKVQLSPENRERLEAGEPPLPVDEDPTGYTGVWDALWIAIQKVLVKTPQPARRAIILLSDGDDTSSRVSKQEAMDLAVKSDVVVYAIGIRDSHFPYGKMDRKALRKVSEQTGGQVFFPTDDQGLRLAFSQIENELRSQYAIAYSPSDKTRDGTYRQVKIEIVSPEMRKRKLRLLYRQGYYAKT